MRPLFLGLLLVACGGGDRDAEADTATTAGSADTASAEEPTALLLVVDNSDSMVQSATSLALGVADVVATLPAGTPVAVTTTDVEASAGALVAPPTTDAAEVASHILCHATCFRDDVLLPSDPAHTCGDPLGAEVTEEWLDCTCGAGTWRNQCGAAIEEGLEALWLATCRADDNAPTTCLDEGQLQGTDLGSIDLGDRVTALIVSDEGDGSRRLEREPEGTVYLDLLASASVDVTVWAVTPTLDGSSVRCPGTATDWGVARYRDVAWNTGGGTADIFDGDCAPRDAAAAATELLR